MLVTKDSGTYRKASYVIVCPCCVCSLMDPASRMLIELIRRVKESIRNFLSTLAYSKLSCRIKSGYPILFDLGKLPFTVSSSALTDGGSQFKVILRCHSIYNNSAR
jgi:hypothetical protein